MGIITEFREQWQIDALFVADAALYTAENLTQMNQLRWVSRVPATLKDAQELLINLHPDALVPSELSGYKIAAVDNQLGKPTAKPRLRWAFQCFMSIYLLTVNGVKHITNLTSERLWCLQFFVAHHQLPLEPHCRFRCRYRQE